MGLSPVLLNDFQRQWTVVRDDVLRAVARTGESGWYILGKQVAGFERALAEFWGLRFAAGVASGLDAIEIALRAAGLQPGDRVLTTPMSAFATTMAIVRLGGIPVFCDTTPQGLIDLDEADAALRAMPGIRYFLPVHLYGLPIPRPSLRALIETHGLICIEDCAQSIGTDCGHAGVAAATSFYPTKNLGAFGDGGAVLSNDETLIESIRRLRDYGQSAKYVHAEIGWNSRLDELHAAILQEALLPRLRDWTERRRSIANRYLEGWTNPDITPLFSREALAESAWHLFPTATRPGEKATWIARLKSAGIATGEHYPAVIPDQPAMASVPFACFGDLPNARRLASTQLSLPIHPFLSFEEVDRVLESLGAHGN